MGLIGACFLLRLIGVDFSGSSSPNCDAATRPQRQHCQRFGTRGNMDTKEGPESDSGQVVRIAVHDLPQAQRHTASINEALAREFWPWEKHKAEAKSRCEFAVVDGSKLTSQEFHQNFVEKEQPALILRSNITRWPAVQTWTYGQLLKSRISDLEFRVGSGTMWTVSKSCCRISDRATLLNRSVPKAEFAPPTLHPQMAAFEGAPSLPVRKDTHRLCALRAHSSLSRGVCHSKFGRCSPNAPRSDSCVLDTHAN